MEVSFLPHGAMELVVLLLVVLLVVLSNTTSIDLLIFDIGGIL